MQARMLISVLWPSFLVAGVGGALIFALIDPLDVAFFGYFPGDRLTVYTGVFFVLWGFAAVSSASTAWLVRQAWRDMDESD